MNSSKMTLPEPRSIPHRIILGLVLAAAIGGISAPAFADNDHDRRARERHERDHRGHGYYAAPAAVYAPPGVVYAPPPGPPALQFVFPLTFR